MLPEVHLSVHRSAKKPRQFLTQLRSRAKINNCQGMYGFRELFISTELANDELSDKVCIVQK